MARRLRVLGTGSLGGAAALLIAFLHAGLAAAAGGDVMVGGVTPGGDLTITGDAEANDITVTQNADGTVTVTGNNGTTVNGQGSFTTPGPVTGKVKIDPKGGDDTTTVDGVKTDDIEVKDELGKNKITVKNSKAKDKLKIKNEDGNIEIQDSSWGRRDIRPGKGGLTPPNLFGEGGAGSTGTPPTSAADYHKGMGSSQVPLNAQQQGLPTSNPGQRGMLPDVPHVPTGPTRSFPKGGYGPPKGGPKY
jgi:hypothetical protein